MSVAFLVCLLSVSILAAIGTPIGYSLLVAAIVYLAMVGSDLSLAAEQLIQSIYDGYILLAVPLFIIAANIMNAGTISGAAAGFLHALVGRFRGGLGHVNIVSSVIFAGMSGSAVADAAGIGKIIIGMMTKAAATRPAMPPRSPRRRPPSGRSFRPSIPMVMYALISGQSIGYLFLAGIIPGLLMAVVLMRDEPLWPLAGRAELKRQDPVPLREIAGADRRTPSRCC
jgi:TRAP-type transport system large permease protein